MRRRIALSRPAAWAPIGVTVPDWFAAEQAAIAFQHRFNNSCTSITHSKPAKLARHALSF